MKRILGNLILLGIIVFIVWKFILPTVLCWQQGGDLKDGVCSMGVIEVPGSTYIPSMNDIKERIDFSKLRELTLKIPSTTTDTSATLSRTNDALERFVATFSGDGSSGSAEAIADLAATDDETGYALVPFVVEYGGSGSFVYLGLFANENGTPVHKDSLLLGDRIKVESVEFERADGKLVAIANFKDRKADDPLVVEPTVATRITAPVADAAFGEPIRTERSDTYIASYKDMIRIANPTPGSTVTTPLVISGEARGGWFFEASFPITIVDWDGRIIGEGIATATGDWMTPEYVPFTASIPYALPNDVPYRRGAIILQKDNPSGLPENDDAFEVPILFR